MQYIEVTIKTLFQGKCAINEKYLKQALKDGKGLAFYHYVRGERSVAQEKMVIPFEELEKRVAYKNGPHKDRYSKGIYYLVYFQWKPDNGERLVQAKLL